MQIFIDSADLSEIKKAADLGVLDGCTTNPSLLSKTGRKIEAAIPEICEIVDGPVSAEVVATAYEEILREGRSLFHHPLTDIGLAKFLDDNSKALEKPRSLP